MWAGNDPASWLQIARDTAPEFFASMVVMQAERGSLTRSAKAREWIEEAFVLAGSAEEPIRLVGVPGLAHDTRARHRVSAGALHMDALSLESSLAVAMLQIDPVRGRDLFQQIPRPAAGPRPCEDPLVADGSAYYRAAGEVLKNGFRTEERGLRLPFVNLVLSRVGSPSDAAAFAEMISSLNLRAPEWELLLGEFSAKLESISPDYRSYGFTFERLSAVMKRIESRAESLGVSTEGLRRSLRRFVIAQESALRCGENYNVSDLSLAARPASRGAAFVAESYAELPGSKDIEDDFAKLKVSSQGPRSEAERSTEEWQTMLADFVHDFEAWQPSGEPIDVFHQKADYWRSLIEVTPRGEARDGLMSRAAAFLASSRMSREHPAEWLWQVQQLDTGAGADQAKLRRIFQASGSAELALYCAQLA